MAKGRFLGEFEQLVLLAVARLGPESYGMTIRREIQRCSGRSVSLAPVYATLSRLEAKGLVRSRTGEPTPVRGGRAPRHFELQPAGVRALQESRGMLDRMWDGLQFEPNRGIS